MQLKESSISYYDKVKILLIKYINNLINSLKSNKNLLSKVKKF